MGFFIVGILRTCEDNSAGERCSDASGDQTPPGIVSSGHKIPLTRKVSSVMSRKNVWMDAVSKAIRKGEGG